MDLQTTKILNIPVTLKGVNYLLWARTAKTSLCGRGFWSHITSSKDPKADSKATAQEGQAIVPVEEDKWFQEDQTVLALLQNSLDSSILEAYSYCETAKELWDTLQNVYGNDSNLNRVFEVKRAINNLQQEEMEFTKHFGKFRSLWAELEMLRPTTLDPKVLNERREQDKVFGLLLTLNSSYNDLIKHILRSEKLPSLEEVCNKIQKEHGSIGLFGGKGELVSANKAEVATVNKSYYKNDGRNSPTCEHCKKIGHLKEKCWVLHPYLRPRNASRPPRANQASASNEGKTSEPVIQLEGNGAALSVSSEFVRRSDLDALIKALKESSGY